MTGPRRRRDRAPFSDNTDRRTVEHAYAGVGQEILAYLQYTVICHLRADFFQRSVVFHFRERLQRIVSLKEVEEKLKYLWNHCRGRTWGNTGWEELLHLGIDGLPHLGQDKIEWVKARACDLKESADTEKTPRLLRSALQSPSPLRVGSKTTSGTPNGPVRSKTPRRKIHRPLSKPSFTLTVPLFSDLPRQRQRQRYRSWYNHADLEDDPDLDSEHGGPSSSLTSESQRNPSVAARATSSFDDIPLDRACTHQNYASQKRARTHTPEYDATAEVRTAQLLSELEAKKSRMSQLELELDELKFREAEGARRRETLCPDYDELLRGNKHLQAVITAKGYEGIVEDNAKLRGENDRLHARVATLRASLQFIPGNWHVLENDSIGKVLRDMEKLCSSLKGLMQGVDIMFSMPKSDIDQHSPLAALCQLGLGSNVAAERAPWTMTVQSSRFKLREIVISLVSAAVCLWVFDADVEALFTSNSPAYAKLTNLLAGQDEENADNMKFAAHKQCVEDPYVKDELIPQQAHRHSRNFFRSIKPLLEAHEIRETEHPEEATTWADAETQTLTEIFTAALTIKTRLLLTTDLFQCSFPAPGTRFDAQSMEKWNEDDHSPQRNVGAGEEVAIVMFPALSRYEANCKVFSYNRFVSGTFTPGAHTRRSLREAIVLTR